MLLRLGILLGLDLCLGDDLVSLLVCVVDDLVVLLRRIDLRLIDGLLTLRLDVREARLILLLQRCCLLVDGICVLKRCLDLVLTLLEDRAHRLEEELLHKENQEQQVDHGK